MPAHPSASVAIRRACAADEPAILRLAARLAGFDVPPWRSPEEIAGADGRAMLASVDRGDPHDQVFVAEREGETVGCLHLLVATDFFGLRRAHISVIATSAEAEGSGVARALMLHADRWARERRLPLLTLNVFAANGRARRFYERAGYTPEIVTYARPVHQHAEEPQT